MLIFSLRLEPCALRHLETSSGRVIRNDLLCVALIMISLVTNKLVNDICNMGAARFVESFACCRCFKEV